MAIDLHCQLDLSSLTFNLALFYFQILVLHSYLFLQSFRCGRLQATLEKLSAQLLTSYEPNFSKYLVGKTTMHWIIVKTLFFFNFFTLALHNQEKIC